jgi:hypothetical protein
MGTENCIYMKSVSGERSLTLGREAIESQRERDANKIGSRVKSEARSKRKREGRGFGLFIDQIHLRLVSILGYSWDSV